MFPKNKTERHQGAALRRLFDAVYDRDEHCCIVCGRWVEDGNKPHHEWGGCGRKSDRIERLILLCYDCHYQRHHGKNSQEITRKCREYLRGIYGEEVDK